MNKSDILTQKGQKIIDFWSVFYSLICFFSLSPRSFLKSYFKMNFKDYLPILENSLELGSRNLLGKVSFNGKLVLLKIIEKGVKMR